MSFPRVALRPHLQRRCRFLGGLRCTAWLRACAPSERGAWGELG
jgi:hypothetical protein